MRWKHERLRADPGDMGNPAVRSDVDIHYGECMVSDIQDGGPAFPRLYPRSDEDGTHGMTLRDYFAAKAMLAIVGSSQYEYAGGIEQEINVAGAAMDAYMLADAMLKARAK